VRHAAEEIERRAAVFREGVDREVRVRHVVREYGARPVAVTGHVAA
jgi:hypothetical protein